MKEVLLTIRVQLRDLEEMDDVKTEKEVMDAIYLQSSDVVDGFELTTFFRNGDNTDQFYLDTAEIISREFVDDEDYKGISSIEGIFHAKAPLELPVKIKFKDAVFNLESFGIFEGVWIFEAGTEINNYTVKSLANFQNRVKNEAQEDCWGDDIYSRPLQRVLDLEILIVDGKVNERGEVMPGGSALEITDIEISDAIYLIAE